MSERPDLKALVEKWAPRLRLGAWAIAVSYGRGFDMGDNNATCRFVVENLNAYIQVLDPLDHPADPFQPTLDVEALVVHELLHILFAGSKISSGERLETIILENAIVRITSLLVAMDRGLPHDYPRVLNG
jgi:hypothetical protein